MGSCRRDLLDHIVVSNERHVKRLLSEYVRYHHEDRTHLGLEKGTPDGQRYRSVASGRVLAQGASRRVAPSLRSSRLVRIDFPPILNIYVRRTRKRVPVLQSLSVVSKRRPYSGLLYQERSRFWSQLIGEPQGRSAWCLRNRLRGNKRGVSLPRHPQQLSRPSSKKQLNPRFSLNLQDLQNAAHRGQRVSARDILALFVLPLTANPGPSETSILTSELAARHGGNHAKVLGPDRALCRLVLNRPLPSTMPNSPRPARLRTFAGGSQNFGRKVRREDPGQVRNLPSVWRLSGRCWRP